MNRRANSLTRFYIAYVIVVIALTAYPLFTLRGNELYDAYDEHHWIEDLQWTHLAVALLAQIVVLGWGPRSGRESRLIEWIGSIFVGWMLIRELNNYWEVMDVYREYYAVMAGMFAALAVLGGLLFVERRRKKTGLWSRPPQIWIRLYLWGFAGYVAANIIAKVFKDLGMERVYWRVIEEGLELLAGTLFLFGAVEALRATLRARVSQ